METLSIKNAKLLKDNSVIYANILVENGKIKHIGSFIDADTVIDAKRNFVIPGLIDSHVHFREPGASFKETWETASKGAVSAGVTTVLDMPNNMPAITTRDLLEEKKRFASNSWCNYGFHFGSSTDNIEEIKKVNNIASIKVYMGSTFGNLTVNKESDLLRIFQVGKMVSLHAEDDSLIKHFHQDAKKDFHENGKHPHHSEVRPGLISEAALSKAINIAKHTHTHLYVTHITTENELKMINQARGEGLHIYCEATPHHLFLTEKDHKDNFTKVNPPLRSMKDLVALWTGIKHKFVDTIATDHAPHTKEEKESHYFDAPSGIPGVETMLPLLLNAVNKRLISIQDVVRLTSMNPARIFNMKGKGHIRTGYDADLVILDMDKIAKVEADRFFSKAKWSPFDNMKLQGWPTTTIVNGRIAYNQGYLHETRGKEIEYNFLPRDHHHNKDGHPYHQ